MTSTLEKTLPKRPRVINQDLAALPRLYPSGQPLTCRSERRRLLARRISFADVPSRLSLHNHVLAPIAFCYDQYRRTD